RALLLLGEPDAVLEFLVDWSFGLWVHGEIILRPEDPESSAIPRPCDRPTAWRTAGTDKGSKSRTFACWRRGRVLRHEREPQARSAQHRLARRPRHRARQHIRATRARPQRAPKRRCNRGSDGGFRPHRPRPAAWARRRARSRRLDKATAPRSAAASTRTRSGREPAAPP